MLGKIKSTYVDSLACVRIKRGESEQFRIDSGMKNKNFLFYTIQGFYIAVAFHQGQGFISWLIRYAFLYTNPGHLLLPCSILLASLISKPLFLKQSFMVLTHLFCSLPID